MPDYVIIVGMDSYPVSVEGVDLVLEQPGKREARFVQAGEELPQDAWGNPILVGADGVRHRLEMGYSVTNLSPSIRVDDRREAIIVSPLVGTARRIWIAILVFGAAGGLLQGWYLAAAGSLCGTVLAQRGRKKAHFVAAGVFMLAAVVAQAWSWFLR